MLRPRIDCHMHTTHSPDGQNTPLEMAQRARELGLETIALTDHCEVDHYFTKGYLRAVPQAFAAAEALKQTCSAPEILTGIEIGQASWNFELCDRLLAQNSYDYVLASMHHLPETTDFYKLAATPEGAVHLLHRYYAELLRVVEWGNFDALAHPNYPMRYIEGAHHLSIPRDVYAEDLDRVLRAVVQRDKALEVNTQGTPILPDLYVLKRFRELGGRLVTIGSDAHSTDALGHGLADGLQMIRDAGFSALTVYRNRKPVEIAIL